MAPWVVRLLVSLGPPTVQCFFPPPVVFIARHKTCDYIFTSFSLPWALRANLGLFGQT